jgi:hypothetical protein
MRHRKVFTLVFSAFILSSCSDKINTLHKCEIQNGFDPATVDIESLGPEAVVACMEKNDFKFLQFGNWEFDCRNDAGEPFPFKEWCYAEK